MKWGKGEGVLFIEVWMLSSLLSAFRGIKCYPLASQIYAALEEKKHFLVVQL